MRLITILAVTVVAVLSSYACGSGPSESGNVRLMITDSPYSDADAVWVTFSEVTAHRAESDWSKLPFAAPDATTAAPTSRTCDLKRLESGATDILGVGNLPAGHYTMVRLVVSAAKLYFDNPTDPAKTAACWSTGSPDAPAEPAGLNATLTIPSGEVKLNRQFELTAADSSQILIDFDGDRSIIQTGNGNYRMTPVIGIVSVTPAPAAP